MAIKVTHKIPSVLMVIFNRQQNSSQFETVQKMRAVTLLDPFESAWGPDRALAIDFRATASVDLQLTRKNSATLENFILDPSNGATISRSTCGESIGQHSQRILNDVFRRDVTLWPRNWMIVTAEKYLCGTNVRNCERIYCCLGISMSIKRIHQS